jgi:hypothetical protein
MKINNFPFRIVFALMLALALTVQPAAAPARAQSGVGDILPPLFPKLAWQAAGIVQKDFFAYGQVMTAAGEMFESRNNTNTDEIFAYYSSENLESLGWSFLGGIGVDLSYQHASGRYLTVEIASCPESGYCVTVWMSLEIVEEIVDQPAGDAPGNTAVAFSKTVPANGATVNVPATTYHFLKWGDGQKSAADRYQYCVDETNNSLCDTDWIDRNSLYSGPGEFTLQPGKTYYWQVRLRDAEINANNGTWWSFKTATPQASFTKISPANGALISMPSTSYQLLQWSAVDKAVSDRYQYCIDQTNNSQCDSEWMTRNSLYSGGPGDFVLEYGKTYYWQVRLRDAGTVANGGAWWSFKVRESETLKAVSIAAQDGWILESSETSNKGGTHNRNAITLQLGDDAARKQYLSILSFNTAPIPDNAVIIKVTLRVKQQGITGGGHPVNIFQGFMVDIKRGTFGAPALVSGDFQAAAQKTVGPIKKTAPNNWYNLNLTSGKDFINKLTTGNGLTQIRLRFKLDDNNNNNANILKLFSSNAAAANRPQLIIQYHIP